MRNGSTAKSDVGSMKHLLGGGFVFIKSVKESTLKYKKYNQTQTHTPFPSLRDLLSLSSSSSLRCSACLGFLPSKKKKKFHKGDTKQAADRQERHLYNISVESQHRGRLSTDMSQHLMQDQVDCVQPTHWPLAFIFPDTWALSWFSVVIITVFLSCREEFSQSCVFQQQTPSEDFLSSKDGNPHENSQQSCSEFLGMDLVRFKDPKAASNKSTIRSSLRKTSRSAKKTRTNRLHSFEMPNIFQWQAGAQLLHVVRVRNVSFCELFWSFM